MATLGALDLRIEPAALDPAPDLVHRLAALATASGAAASPPAPRPGWQVGLAAAGVAGIVGGGAWLAANLGADDGSVRPTAPATTPGQSVVPSTPRATQQRVRRDRTIQPEPVEQGGTITSQPGAPLSDDQPNAVATAPVDPPDETSDGGADAPGDDPSASGDDSQGPDDSGPDDSGSDGGGSDGGGSDGGGSDDGGSDDGGSDNSGSDGGGSDDGVPDIGSEDGSSQGDEGAGDVPAPPSADD